jgi:hypothetical protein
LDEILHPIRAGNLVEAAQKGETMKLNDTLRAQTRVLSLRFKNPIIMLQQMMCGVPHLT